MSRHPFSTEVDPKAAWDRDELIGQQMAAHARQRAAMTDEDRGRERADAEAAYDRAPKPWYAPPNPYR